MGTEQGWVSGAEETKPQPQLTRGCKVPLEFEILPENRGALWKA